MPKILAGLFESHNDYKKLETDLESSGFGSSDYIVYINDSHQAPQYLASVAVDDNEKVDNAKNIFSRNAVVKTYLLDDMTIQQADYNSIKKFIDAKSKAEIHTSPELKIKGSTEGIDSEVKS